MGVFKKVAAVIGAGVVLAAAIPTFADAAQQFQKVIVANEDSDPVPVAEQNLDPDGNIKVREQGTVAVQEARQPYQRNALFDHWDGKRFRNFDFEVPDGKMLVVQSVSFQVEVEPGQQAHAEVDIQGAPGAHPVKLAVPMEREGTFRGKDLYVGTQNVAAYGAGSLAILASAKRSSSSGNGGTVRFNVTGYLVDKPT